MKRYLIDTHVFLWWITDSQEITQRVRAIIENEDNEILLSAASGWEIAIKTRLGRLRLPKKPDAFVLQQMTLNNITPLAVTMAHALYVHNLPDIHRDPFDRLLVAQSLLENAPIITRDAEIARYQVKVVW